MGKDGKPCVFAVAMIAHGTFVRMRSVGPAGPSVVRKPGVKKTQKKPNNKGGGGELQDKLAPVFFWRMQKGVVRRSIHPTLNTVCTGLMSMLSMNARVCTHTHTHTQRVSRSSKTTRTTELEMTNCNDITISRHLLCTQLCASVSLFSDFPHLYSFFFFFCFSLFFFLYFFLYF